MLKEKRQAVISHAVTSGLDRSVLMRDSGVDWLGAIPTHWKTIPLRYEVSLVSGATPNKTTAKYWDGSIPWVSPKDMKVSLIEDAEDHVSDVALQETGLRLIRPGRLLVVVRGMILLHSFPIAQNAVAVTINQDMKAIECSSKLLPNFLEFILIGATKLLVSLSGESAHGTKKMETSVLMNICMPLPPVGEQSVICSWLREQIANLQSLHSSADMAIQLLQERRSALISAAVTGKIDVRNYANQNTGKTL